MLKSYKYRLYPTKPQIDLINKHIDSCRFVYNLALETKQMAYAGNRVILTCFEIIKQLPDLKKECAWLKEINSQSLQQSIVNLDVAFTNFFKGTGDFPSFKKKTFKQSFNIPQNIIVDLENNIFIIPKFKKGISIVLHRKFIGDIKQATISKTSTGKYFASILIENNIEIIKPSPVSENTTIGIDLGIKTFLVSSDGRQFDNPKYLHKAQIKLKYLNRKYSAKKGKRTKYKLAILYEKINNQRKDFLNKTSSYIINNHDTIAIENLNIAGMLKNHNLAQAISDASWSEFVRQLEYKANWLGKNILKIGRFEPSSKFCSVCGHINKQLTLKDRKWVCPKCKTLHDRDINAAINIKNFALKNHLSAEHRLKNRNELPALVGVMTSEAIPIYR